MVDQETRDALLQAAHYMYDLQCTIIHDSTPGEVEDYLQDMLEWAGHGLEQLDERSTLARQVPSELGIEIVRAMVNWENYLGVLKPGIVVAQFLMPRLFEEEALTRKEDLVGEPKIRDLRDLLDLVARNSKPNNEMERLMIEYAAIMMGECDRIRGKKWTPKKPSAR